MLTAIIVIFPTFPPASTVLINWSMQIKVPESSKKIVAWSFAFSLGPTFQHNSASRSRLLQHHHCNWDSGSKSSQNNHLFCQHQRCSEPTRAAPSQIDPRLVEHQALGSAGDHHDQSSWSWLLNIHVMDDESLLDLDHAVGWRRDSLGQAGQGEQAQQGHRDLSTMWTGKFPKSKLWWGISSGNASS